MSETILIVDYMAAQRNGIEEVIQKKLQYNTMSLHNGEAAVRWLKAGRQPQPDFIVLDMHTMPTEENIRIIREIRTCKTNLPLIVLAHYGEDNDAARAVEAGACDFLTKPVGLQRLKISIQNAMRIQRLNSRIAQLERKVGGHISFMDIIGKSPEMMGIISLAEKAAQSKAPLWLEGKAGVGKEWLARAIHGSSSRAGKPFVIVDCRHLSAETAAASIFGQEQMMGRQQFVLGKVREANGGTLLFKEITALPQHLHNHLIETITENALVPLGSYSSIPLDIRIICTSTLSPNQMSEGFLNSALYRKLKGITIYIPELAERKMDIAPLARHFIRMHSTAENKFIYGLNDAAMELLCNQPWPGNVRQLSNLLYRAVILCNQETLDAGNLHLVQHLEPFNYKGSLHVVATGAPALVDREGRVRKLRAIEDEVIAYALRHADGCMTRAARNLGIGRSTLYRRVNEMSLEGYVSRANQTTRPMMAASSGERS